jgi:hypothetical protein
MQQSGSRTRTSHGSSQPPAGLEVDKRTRGLVPERGVSPRHPQHRLRVIASLCPGVVNRWRTTSFKAHMLSEGAGRVSGASGGGSTRDWRAIAPSPVPARRR